MDVKEVGYPNGRFRFALLALVAVLAMPTVRAAPSKIAFNIPAGEFSQAIIEFSKQSQVEILYTSMGSLGDLKTHAVMGELGVPEALTRMLEGTGFTFEFDSARSVLLKRKGGGAAQAGPTGVSPAVGDAQTKLAAAFEEQTVNMQEIVVTGSLIHGLRDITSPLVIVGDKEKKRAAYATVQDVLRTLPFNFGGDASEDFSTNQNLNRGSSINLRGLGSGATLVLVDGQRQPMSGFEGDFVDISTIPLSAVERIEVLPDGASALYGSDAIAGVVNVIMRQDYEGFETQTRLGTAPGGDDETLMAQSFGHHWDGGKVMFAYQYSRGTALPGEDRAYSASADKRPLGGSDLRSSSSNPGNILDPFTLNPVFAIPSGQDGRSLTPNQLLPGVVNLQNQVQGRDLLPDKWAHGVFATASQKFGDHFELFAEGRFNYRHTSATERAYDQLLTVPASNPFFVDPFGGMPFVIVAYNFLKDLGPVHDTGVTETYTTTVGANTDIAGKWRATLSAFNGRESMRSTAYNEVNFLALDEKLADSDPATAFNPFGSGSNTNPATLEAIRQTQVQRAVSGIKSINLSIDGPLADLSIGTPKLATGINSRQESLERDVSSPYDRRVTAAFAELSLPFYSRFEFSLASRYEKYSDFGDTYNPKIGVRWSPIQSLRLRGSWGSSFRAPTLVDLYDHSQDFAFLFPIVDTHSPTGQSNVLVRTGSNPALHEERAATWTTGVDFAPQSHPGFTASATYYAVYYKDRIWQPRPPLTPEMLLAQDQWASLVTRNPNQSQISAICGSPLFLGSSLDCTNNPPTVILDIRQRNLSATTVNGVDMELRQLLTTRHGTFELGMQGGYIFDFNQAITNAAPALDLVDTVGNPSRVRMRGTADWRRYGRDQPGVGASLAVNYLSGARDYENPPVTQVSGLATFDLQVSYRMAESDRWLGSLDLSLNAVNIFNQSPPFVNRLEGYDPFNTKPYGRVVSFGIQKHW